MGENAMAMIRLKITDFPRFVDAHIKNLDTWVTDLHNDGYVSACFSVYVEENIPIFLMNELEYTHFVLRWG